MSGIKNEPEQLEDEIILPKLEFDIIEADDDVEDDKMEDEESQDFDFPLFSMSKPSEPVEDEEDRGRSITKSNTMRITLRSPSPEIINQERPESYYFANYTNDELLQFQQSAITGDDVWSMSNIQYNIPGKLINLDEFNTQIQKEIEQTKTKRPGKKKRIASIKGKEHRKEVLKLEKIQKAKEKAKLMKKIHHKRGGKKNKKKAAPQPQQQNKPKPKYRTE
ncbi:hypothetical protein BN7_3186 [Wickerhamomyces ciferrii]|uniref:Uncharacterized protein n=1 Tax=Wickerhamomyces ciferrii (strain ATCC 14091 / BCRC 22168 / CBS 111 / JCM 3599 / NBRC 0793 / NRRL Y-1031 F-60-10) TaxID=1206466 RepID=K0KQT4_WICCF|nr:uncharacterized protein BN7_3186 [Wickerhamomyces ciferrii]CCH43633.1 hypothetical protein BN7_3186 [Wickerhamomyces ciferrii]